MRPRSESRTAHEDGWDTRRTAERVDGVVEDIGDDDDDDDDDDFIFGPLLFVCCCASVEKNKKKKNHVPGDED